MAICSFFILLIKEPKLFCMFSFFFIVQRLITKNSVAVIQNRAMNHELWPVWTSITLEPWERFRLVLNGLFKSFVETCLCWYASSVKWTDLGHLILGLRYHSKGHMILSCSLTLACLDHGSNPGTDIPEPLWTIISTRKNLSLC